MFTIISPLVDARRSRRSLPTSLPGILAKRSSLHDDAHTITDLVLPLARFRFQRIESLLLVANVDFCWCHSYRSVISIVVRMHKVIQNVDVSSRIRIRERAIHFVFRVLLKPPRTDLHEILHRGSSRRRNQPCQILSQSDQAFRFCVWGSNFWLSHRNEMSPLTHGLSYTVQPVIYACCSGILRCSGIREEHSKD